MATTERRVIATLGERPYTTHLLARGIAAIADEPPEQGGQDVGQAPHELLLSALAACTAITMRMYAARKGWPIDGLEVSAHMRREQEGRDVDTRIRLELRRPDGLTDEQWERMMQIGAACPVHRTLTSPLRIEMEGPAAPGA